MAKKYTITAIVEEETDVTDPTTEPEEPEYWDSRLDGVGITYEARDGDYRLYAAWLTINGNWDDVPDWAKQWQDDSLGGDHNAFGRCESSDGSWQTETFALTWPDGGDVREPESSGWANIPIYGNQRAKSQTEQPC